MSDTGKAVAIVKKYFGAAHQDEAALLSLVARDAVIHVPESLPYGGLHRGHDGFRNAIAGFASAWGSVESLELRFLANGDTVVALSRMRASAANNGSRFETLVAETFRIKNGQIVGVRPYYFDTAAILEHLHRQ